MSSFSTHSTVANPQQLCLHVQISHYCSWLYLLTQEGFSQAAGGVCVESVQYVLQFFQGSEKNAGLGLTGLTM